jgi:hypothetical protein
VHWDGSKWELKKIYVEYRGQPNLAPLKGVFALNDGAVVFSSGLPYLPTKNGWKLYHLWDMGVLDQNDGSLYEIWGTSINNLYFAGSRGTIVHYDGVRWERIESGTDERGNDVWGFIHPDGGYTVYFAFSDSYKPGRHLLLKSDNNGPLQVTDWPDSVYIESIWTDNPCYLFACGSGVWRRTDKGWSKYSGLPAVFRERIRGNAINNIFVVGHRSQILHFNGASWYVYQFTQLLGIIEGLAVKGNTVYATSYNGRNAFIIKGTHIK